MSNSTHPLMNAAQGVISSGLLTQGTLTTGQAYNQAIVGGSAIYRDDWMAPRVRIEVDRVTNGYVLAVGSERLIAKDLEELQQHFIAQVVSKLVLDKDK
jgi:hypothetical protein